MIKAIVSGGGTGGHIYPAVAVAEALKQRYGASIEILFVGAEGKMEMEKVPALGYKIVGLPIAGLQRRLEWRNLLLPFKVVRSLCKARRVIKEFDADIVVGFGGYASAPIIWTASKMGVATIIQEQNSYAGMTNKIVGSRAKCVCVAYEGMERFFPGSDIVLTGNPLRGKFGNVDNLRKQALEYFGFDAERPVVLVVGGSLGTRTLNNMMQRWVESRRDRINFGDHTKEVDESGHHLNYLDDDVQVIWQTGKIYEQECHNFLQANPLDGVWQGAFLERMDLAYAAADIVISRSGACTISELCLVAKPTIFVPSPNVAEDHQTKNALALVERDAAIMVHDWDAVNVAMQRAVETLRDKRLMKSLHNNIAVMAQPQAAELIVDQIDKVLKAQTAGEQKK